MLDELQPRRVDQHVGQLDIRIVSGDARHRFAPEAGGLEYVHLVHGGEMPASCAGELKCAARDSLDRLR
jgi:hypothetical protein